MSTKMTTGNIVLAGIGVAIGFVILAVLASALGAALLMFGLGLLHKDVAAVPALGFFASFGTLLSLGVIGGALRGTKVEAKS